MTRDKDPASWHLDFSGTVAICTAFYILMEVRLKLARLVLIGKGTRGLKLPSVYRSLCRLDMGGEKLIRKNQAAVMLGLISKTVQF